LINFFTNLYRNPTVQFVLLFLYYLLIIVGLIWMYGKGDFTFHPFVYQAF
jgi:hypothetical protein